ncbi:MAG: cytochrome c3 family protein [Bryobacteraceae bacterium]|nr:cytochrome c3 family protein [Bryobacteraceae bacterium]MDW8377931.1 cytochrome c3 family protein [Bryobacterales bacterium]
MRALLGLAVVAAWAQELGTSCLPCHSEHVADVRAHKHGARQVGCEVCHGVSETHRNASGGVAPDRVAAPDEVPLLCGGCHGEERKQYLASKHGKLVMARSKIRAPSCGVCHGVHAQRNAVAMRRQCDRCHTDLPASCKPGQAPPAGKLVCAQCHAPHSLQTSPRPG